MSSFTKFINLVKSNSDNFYDEYSKNQFINKLLDANQSELNELRKEYINLVVFKKIYKEKPSKNVRNIIRNRLINKISKLPNAYFSSEASRNALKNRIAKAKTFNKLKAIDDYINNFTESNKEAIRKLEPVTQYKDSVFNKIILSKTEDYEIYDDLNEVTKTYEYIYTSKKFIDEFIKLEEEYKTETSASNAFVTKYKNKIKELSNKYPKNIIKITITFESPLIIPTLELDGTYTNELYYKTPSSYIFTTRKSIKDKSTLNIIMFELFYRDSKELKIFDYYVNVDNELNYIPREETINKKVYIRIHNIPRIQKYKDNQIVRGAQKFEASNNPLKCVPASLLKYFTKKNEQVNENNRHYSSMINKLKDEKYNKPFNQDELKELAEDLEITITIRDFYNEDLIISPNKTPYFNIVLVNTRLNHLEAFNNEEQEINNNDVFDLLKDISYYVKRYNKIYTLDKTYIINSSNTSKAYNQIQKDYKLEKINITSNESKYIDSYYMSIHQIFNKDMYNKYISDVTNLYDDEEETIIDDLDQGTDNKVYVQQLNDVLKYYNKIKEYEQKNYREIDIKKAYYNLTNQNKYGFPSSNFLYFNSEYAQELETHIKKQEVGYYRIIINESNDKLKLIGLTKDSEHTLTTPQLVTLKNNNVDFTILSCLIAPSINFKLSEETLNKDDGIKLYCKIVGLLMADGLTTETIIKTENPIEYLKILNINDEDIFIDHKNLINILAKESYTYKHIGFFIHSLVSSEILNLLLTNDINDIMGVKLDSIIVKKDAKITFNESIFTDDKEPKIYELSKAHDDFNKSYLETKEVPEMKEIRLNNKLIKNKIIVLIGKGGAGKTESVKRTIPSNQLVYSSLSWDRCVDFKNKSTEHIFISSLNRLVGDKCEIIKLPKSIRYIILDEITLINYEIIKKIIELYPTKRIILIGDITKKGFYYQCSLEKTIDNFSLFNPNDYKDIDIIKYTKNYRFDDHLNNELDKFRKAMKNIIKSNKTDYEKSNLLKQCIIHQFKNNIKSLSQITYNDNDIGISEIDDIKAGGKLTEYFLSKGTKPKYYTNQTKYEKGIFKGQISYEKPSHNYYETRLFTTIHSCQGYTLDHNQKIIIYIHKNFDFRLFYTALSRARTINQIVIIKDRIY